jgi:magnesium chelatase family protein
LPPSSSAISSFCTSKPPHHTISYVALVGGGTFPYTGEISFGHNGELFPDELPEFKQNVLEVIRKEWWYYHQPSYNS